MLLVDQMLMDGSEGEATNSSRRKNLYRQMTLILNGGPLGKGVRIDLPECVKRGIRDLFPNADGKYMGFLAK